MLRRKFGNWTVTSYTSVSYDENGGISGGIVKLVSQVTLEVIIIRNDNALRGDAWFTQDIKGIQVLDRNLKKTIEKTIVAYDKFGLRNSPKKG